MSVKQFHRDKLLEPFEVLAVHFHIIVSGTLHPQWLHSPRAFFIDGDSVREVNHLIFRAMDHEDWRCDFGHLIDAGECVEEPRALRGGKGHSHARHEG